MKALIMILIIFLSSCSYFIIQPEKESYLPESKEEIHPIVGKWCSDGYTAYRCIEFTRDSVFMYDKMFGEPYPMGAYETIGDSVFAPFFKSWATTVTTSITTDSLYLTLDSVTIPHYKSESEGGLK